MPEPPNPEHSFYPVRNQMSNRLQPKMLLVSGFSLICFNAALPQIATLFQNCFKASEKFFAGKFQRIARAYLFEGNAHQFPVIRSSSAIVNVIS